jgi:precorrin-6B methylase 2
MVDRKRARAGQAKKNITPNQMQLSQTLRSNILDREVAQGGTRNIIGRRYFNMRLLGGGTHESALKVLEAYDPFSSGHPCSTRTREETYGELTDVQGLLRHLPHALEKNSVFVDVGSGYGRLAMYVALTAPCSRVVGLELHPCRHEMAAKMQREQAALVPHLQFKHRDARQGVPPDSTHIFMCSTCFTPELSRSIVEGAPSSVVCIVSLTPLEAPQWALHGQKRLECTWATSNVYYYVKAHSQ